MPELSPTAQAVLDAYQSASDGCYVNGEWIQDHAGQIAAALRAVADQVVPEGGVFLSTAGAARIRQGILAIAAELEGRALPQSPTQPTTDPC